MSLKCIVKHKVLSTIYMKSILYIVHVVDKVKVQSQ